MVMAGDAYVGGDLDLALSSMRNGAKVIIPARMGAVKFTAIRGWSIESTMDIGVLCDRAWPAPSPHLDGLLHRFLRRR